MKIAYIGSRGFPGFPSGVEKCLEEVCPRLVARGHEVTVYCSSGVATHEVLYRGTRLTRLPAFPTKHLETLSRTFLAGIHAWFGRYDIVHYHSIGPAVLAWMGRLGPGKTVVTVHGLDWQRAKWGGFAKAFLKAGERAAGAFPHRTVVVSKALRRYYKERYGKDVVYIPNGVSIYDSPRPDEIRRRWGLENKGYLFFASRLVPEKGCHTLIEAFRKLKTDKRLVIAGESWYSDDYVARLKALADGAPNILFTGWAGGGLLKELFANAYLYCLPSEIEGLSLSLLEGMSYAVCPVVSDIVENRDVVEKTGVTFRTGDAEDLIAKLKSLLEDAPRAERLGRAARELVRQKYDWDTVAGQWEEVYKDLC